jgi:hypothetical protein
MQAKEELQGWKLRLAKIIWASHRWSSLGHSWALSKIGLHKQLANRLTESHAHIKVLVTSTLWENFFQLRAHPDAQPEFYKLANEIIAALEESQPKELKPFEWHLPYVTRPDRLDQFVAKDDIAEKNRKLRLISAARCARVSYTTIDDARFSCISDDYNLGSRLVAACPLHASPMEHQATPDPFNSRRHLWGNFHGWVQHRKMFTNEACMENSHALSHNLVSPIREG